MPEPLSPTVQDFFISHVASDKEWAEWLVWLLESKGYRPVCVPENDWGANPVALVDQTLRQASCVIPLLSVGFFTSPLARAEWTPKFDPTGAKRELLPIRVGRVEVEGLLKPITYVDLVDLDEKEAILKLESALARLQVEPANPTVPGGKQSKPDFPYLRIDVLIEYCDTEFERVKDLRAELESKQYTVYEDLWKLAGGTPSRNSPVPASVRPKCRAVCVGDAPFLWARSEIQGALNRQQNDTALRVVPILYPGSPETKLREAFDEIQTWADAIHAFTILESAFTGRPLGTRETAESPRTPSPQAKKRSYEIVLEELHRLGELNLLHPDVLKEGQRQAVTEMINAIHAR